jgi:hypothetical protein
MSDAAPAAAPAFPGPGAPAGTPSSIVAPATPPILEAADLERLVGQSLRTEELVINMGPQHPSTHGVLRVVIKTDGEVVTALQPHVGNLHRCAEKIGESLPYYQWLPYVDRMDYLAAINNEHGACTPSSGWAGSRCPSAPSTCGSSWPRSSASSPT